MRPHTSLGKWGNAGELGFVHVRGGATGLISFHGPGCVGHGSQLLALLFVVVGHCCVCSLLTTYFYTNIVPPTIKAMLVCTGSAQRHRQGIVDLRASVHYR